MDQPSSTNPLFISLFFVLRCVVPLVIMFGISYVLRRLGVIARPPEPPAGWNDEETYPPTNDEGGLAHAKH
jgi:hypothetical protein